MADTKIASTLTPASNQAGKSAAVRQFKITDIPAAMDKMSWPVAAKLMRHWFNGKPWSTPDGAMSKEVKDHDALPDLVYVESTIVKMAWLNQFEPAKAVIKELESVWDNPPARANISKKLKISILVRNRVLILLSLIAPERLKSLGTVITAQSNLGS